MSEEFEENLYKANQKLHEAFAKNRIQKIKSQKTFGTPDHEAVKPALEVIRKGEARAFIVAVETRQGIKFYHKSFGSEHLLEYVAWS